MNITAVPTGLAAVAVAVEHHRSNRLYAITATLPRYQGASLGGGGQKPSHVYGLLSEREKKK